MVPLLKIDYSFSCNRFHHGPYRLSYLMRKSLSRDPLDPILWPLHFEAMDRRVAITLRVTRHCLNRLPADQVLLGLTDWMSARGWSKRSCHASLSSQHLCLVSFFFSSSTSPTRNDRCFSCLKIKINLLPRRLDPVDCDLIQFLYIWEMCIPE